MKKTIIVTGTMLALAATTAFAETSVSSDQSMSYKQDPADMYRSSELSLGLFGTGTVGEYTLEHVSGNRIRQNGRLGAGADLTYFFCRYVGIQGEAWTENTAHNFVDDAAGSLVARLPIGNSGLAPYIFGGGGHSFDPAITTFGHFGAGLEFRFTQHFGVFVDGRYVIPDKLGNYGLAALVFGYLSNPRIACPDTDGEAPPVFLF